MVKVWVNGCFDILHRGHVELFKYAKSLGDHLKVGLDSDWKVRKVKGTERPINRELDRAALVRCIEYVDEVAIFHNAQELGWYIKDYGPDVLVVGSEGGIGTYSIWGDWDVYVKKYNSSGIKQ